MTLLTTNDLGKFFTDNNNKSKGELIEIYLCKVWKQVRVKLLYEGGVVDETLTSFLSNYKLATQYPPKGAICECTINTANSTFVLYSDGKGSYSTSKSNYGAMYRHSSFDLIKIIK